MIEPLLLLIMGVALVAILLFLVVSGRSVVRRLFGGADHMRRIHTEDVLKHAYDCEDRGLAMTLQSAAGMLTLSLDETARVLGALEEHGFLRSRQEVFTLTPEGRSYALRILRVHRLWERYLADETSIHEADWHREAERQEHKLTAEEVDALAAQMGNPQYDPHGDPIPSSDGVVPARKGEPLASVRAGTVARIVHLEDEPPAVYAQLVAQGVYRGMQIYVIESAPERVRFEANGEECVLAPLLARNVTVETLVEQGRERIPYRTLASLSPGQTAIVTSISPACRGAQRRRLMDLGIVPGTRVEAELGSLTGDPVAYTVRGTLVALRKQQADQILIRSLEDAA